MLPYSIIEKGSLLKMDSPLYSDLQKYIQRLKGAGAANVLVIRPSGVVTAPWVRWKCRYGCNRYGLAYCCPPDSPDYAETRQLLDSYQRGLLIHFEVPEAPEFNQYRTIYKALHDQIIDTEFKIFKDGYYKAFTLLFGPCTNCAVCAKSRHESCTFGKRARPAMEACGIDVFQTVRNHGLPIQTLRDYSPVKNQYSLLLVD